MDWYNFPYKSRNYTTSTSAIFFTCHMKMIHMWMLFRYIIQTTLFVMEEWSQPDHRWKRFYFSQKYTEQIEKLLQEIYFITRNLFMHLDTLLQVPSTHPRSHFISCVKLCWGDPSFFKTESFIFFNFDFIQTSFFGTFVVFCLLIF